MALILAPLRGVTIRCFRETFADEIAAAGFTEAVTPFISAMSGVDPLKDRELLGTVTKKISEKAEELLITPQFIGKDPLALRECLRRIRAAGYVTADLNCGCPFPMVRNKGRGSGLMRSPETLAQMLAVGCEVMGPGAFSVKTRLGIERTDELIKLMPIFNAFPLRHLCVHARTARQMYDGECDHAAFMQIAAVAKIPLVYNGDVAMNDDRRPFKGSLMIGRGFIRALGAKANAKELLLRYLAASEAELSGERPVLGRLKELLAYWGQSPRQFWGQSPGGLGYWAKRWNLIKICRSLEELKQVI